MWIENNVAWLYCHVSSSQSQSNDAASTNSNKHRMPNCSFVCFFFSLRKRKNVNLLHSTSQNDYCCGSQVLCFNLNSVRRLRTRQILPFNEETEFRWKSRQIEMKHKKGYLTELPLPFYSPWWVQVLWYWPVCHFLLMNSFNLKING